jgi:cell division protease FtsH
MAQAKKTTQAEFEQFLRDGEVSKVEIVNKKIAHVYLTTDALNEEKHLKNKPKGFLAPGLSDPNYQFEFGDLQNFENNFQTIKDTNKLDTQIVWQTESNVWGEVLVGLLPFIVIIGIWIFIMRRMSAGGGGGAGGQIFNIGKSKAKLFDEKVDVKTSFKDVAGLEGAKEEVQNILL